MSTDDRPVKRSRPRDYPVHTRATFKSWFTDPGAIPKETHERYCEDGYLDIEEDGYRQMLVCPICDRARQIAKEEVRVTQGLEISGIGERYWQVEWESLELVEPLPRIKRASDKIGEALGSGQSLLLFGPPGSGKSQSATLLIKAAVRAGFTARLVNLGQLAVSVRESYSDPGEGLTEHEAIRDLSKVDLLVWDDLGAGETKKAEVEKRLLYLILEARLNAGLVTVVTTNLAPDALSAKIGVRVFNRLQPLAMVAFAHGRNFRIQKSGASFW